MPKKKKGVDPAAVQAEKDELEKLTREYYLKSYRREHVKSAGHRTAHKDKGKVPGFDPQPYPDIDTEKLDRLIVRKSQRSAWEDADGDEPHIVVNDDPDGSTQQEYLRTAQHGVHDHLYHIMSSIDGIDGRSEIEVTEDEMAVIDTAVDEDVDCYNTRDLSAFRHQVFVRPSETVDMVETLEALWQRKTCGLLEELRRHLNVPIGKLSILASRLACRYLPSNHSRTHADLLVMIFYTCDPLTADHLLGFWTGLVPPPNYTPRSPNISHILNEALRVRDLKTTGEWINFICILAASSSGLSPDKMGRTLYCGLRHMPQDLATIFKTARVDDVHYWPCLTSASIDMDLFVSDDHVAIFVIRGAKAGVDLTQCSRSPQQMEILLPPFTLMRVKAKLDSRKIELEVMDDPGEIPTQTRKRWRAFLQEVKECSRRTVEESRVIQRYQLSYRQTQKHKATLQQIGQLVAQAEAEADALLNAATDRSRTMAGAKNATQSKPADDPQVNLDNQKVGVLDHHLVWTRKEQGRLERELRVLKGAITTGTDELMRDENEADPDVRHLLKLQTEHYNEMVTLYEAESARADEIAARIAALRPVDASRKGNKKTKKK